MRRGQWLVVCQPPHRVCAPPGAQPHAEARRRAGRRRDRRPGLVRTKAGAAAHRPARLPRAPSLWQRVRVDPTDPRDCDGLDLRPVLRQTLPSCGPGWDAAIELGFDVGQPERNLALTPTERLQQLHQLTVLYELIQWTAAAGHS